MKNSSHSKERRGHPRIMMRVPANLQINEDKEDKKDYSGLTADASESGLLIQTIKDMPVKTTLNIEVLFPKGFELSNFKGIVEIIRKDICNWKDFEGYQYGLKIIRISGKNYSMLKKLLTDHSLIKEAHLVDNPEHDATLIVNVE